MSFKNSFQKKYNYRPWGAENAYMSFAIWARMRGRTFYPPDVIEPYEKGETFLVTVTCTSRQDGQLVVPQVIIVRGKKPADMKNSEDYWEVTEVVLGNRSCKSRTPSAVISATTPNRYGNLLRGAGWRLWRGHPGGARPSHSLFVVGNACMLAVRPAAG